jgi:DNA-binding protein YbaB
LVTPEEWLANFEAKIADVQQKTAAFKESLEASGATESSDDGALRVTVAPNGALTGLTIEESAMRRSGGELAGQIMQLARKAQRSAAVNVAEAFAPLAGEDSESLHMVVGYVPPEEEEDEPVQSTSYTFTDDQPQDAEPSSRPPAEPPGGPRRQRPIGEDDEEFGDDQIFGRRDDW